MEKEILVYTNDLFRKLLIYTIASFLVINIIVFIMGNWVALISLLLQGSILIVHFKKWPEQRMLIKFWAILMFAYGSVSLIGACADEVLIYLGNEELSVSLLSVLWFILCISLSIYFFIKLNKYSKIISYSENNSEQIQQTSS